MARKLTLLSAGIAIICSGYLGVHALIKNPCTVPKTWSLEAIDPRFGISKETVQKYAKEAAATWNTAYAPNPLLIYKETGGDITLTFVYDDRQRTTVENEQLKQTIGEQKAELSTIRVTIESLQAEYSALGKTIHSNTALYNEQLVKHNNEVAYWNSKGGAPNEIYRRLQTEAVSLEATRAALNKSIGRYNQLANEIKEYGKDHNQIVETVNEQIHALNETAMRDFEEGTYDPNTKVITIYEYASANALKRVITHEFGHALSLDHVDDKEAIMYSINQGKSLNLTEADRTELHALCREKTLQDAIMAIKTIRDDIVRLSILSLTDKAAQSK